MNKHALQSKASPTKLGTCLNSVKATDFPLGNQELKLIAREVFKLQREAEILKKEAQKQKEYKKLLREIEKDYSTDISPNLLKAHFEECLEKSKPAPSFEEFCKMTEKGGVYTCDYSPNEYELFAIKYPEKAEVFFKKVKEILELLKN